MSKEYDFINPEHYKQAGDKEVWEMMVDIWGHEAFVKYCWMCAFKYRMRVGRKPDQPVERDLHKARWYEQKAREIKAEFDADTKRFEGVADNEDFTYADWARGLSQLHDMTEQAKRERGGDNE